MNLRSRLSRLQSQSGRTRTEPARRQTAGPLQQRLAGLRPERVGAPARGGLTEAALAEALGGEVIAEGLIRIQRHIPPAGEPKDIDCSPLDGQPRLPGDREHRQRRQVYIDTETTGLSGGSGTLAFLVGIALAGRNGIVLSQFLLTRFAAEAALLSTLADALTADDRLVSYNGKSYDLPLLCTRYRMHALAHPFGRLPHLDLLHPVRRLFGRRWEDCRLLTLERRLLGFTRIDDLPGSEAPAAWFDYVRGGDGDRLLRVVDHNRQDIVSLALAHGHLARAVEQPLAFEVELPALARWLAEHDEAAARELLQAHAAHLDAGGKRLLGQYCRRAGDWPRAVAIWEQLAEAGCTESLERLAMYHEHVSRDLQAARRCCERLPPGTARAHRHRRIERKLSRPGTNRQPG